MRPVGTAVRVVCVQAMVSFLLVDMGFIIEGNQKFPIEGVVKH